MRKGLVAVVQARVGSTRLPNKVLLPLCGKPVLWHVVNRLASSQSTQRVVVATSDLPANDAIRDLCRAEKIVCFSGSEEDVLDRFYRAAKEQKAEHVIRVTADCPLVDPAVMDRVVDAYFAENLDYAAVATGAGVAKAGFTGRYPDGFDAEVFRFSVLETAWKEAKEKPQREHVTPFIWKQPNRFRMRHITSSVDYSQLRLTLDHQSDYEVIAHLFDKLYPANPRFGLSEIVAELARNPEIAKRNADLSKAQNYQEFWREDKKQSR